MYICIYIYQIKRSGGGEEKYIYINCINNNNKIKYT